MTKSILTKINSLCIFSYVFLCLLFPAAEIVISKKMVFALILFLCLCQIITKPKIKITNVHFFLRIITMILIVLIFSLTTIGHFTENVIFLIFSTIPLLLFFVVYNKEKEFFCFFLICSNLLAFFTIIIALLPILSRTLSMAFNALFLVMDSGYIGERNFGSLKLSMVHFRTAPVFIISLSFNYLEYLKSHKKRNFFSILLTIFAIFFTASRGIYAFSLSSLYLILFTNLRDRKNRIIIFTLTVVIICGLNYVLINTNMFSLSEKSNSIKQQHFLSFIEYIGGSPFILITGAGTGSEYFTSGFNRFTFQTEITYLDMIRYWGIPCTLIFLFCIIYPIKRIKVKFIVPFIFYFIDAATNPLIFCSTGVLIVVLFYSIQSGHFD